MMRPMPTGPGLRSLLRGLGRREPRTRGILRVRGPGAQITIARDRWGIPHVEAAGDADAWFALGFCHAQDRGFQLEILARAGRGTLAEMLGRPALPIDRLSRTLGFRRLAARQLGVLDPDVRAMLEAYVAGVNAAATVTPRPHELVLLRTPRSPWVVTDTLAFLGLQSLALASNWDTELARLRILLADGPEALRAATTPGYAPWLPVTSPVGAAAGPQLDRLGVDLAALRDLVGGSGASNALAVAGSRTASGSPILANDPHLAPSVPAPWYLAHLRTPDWEVAGSSFVGGPAFPTGHNGHAAWGITAGCTDSADLFWEELDLRAGTCRGPNGPEPIQRLSEPIAVRGEPPHVEEILLTPRGPVVTPILDDVPIALSLRATWLEPVPVRGLIDVQRARDWEEFRHRFRAWPGPSLNVVYADAGGHIGWQLVGTLPRRRGSNGLLPQPAWDPDAGWDERHLPFDAMPCEHDPDAGFVVTANHAPRADAADHPFLGTDWLDGYRAARLIEAIGEDDSWTVEATAALQADVAAVPWAEIRSLVLGLPAVVPDAQLALDLLRDWDGSVSVDSSAASVYEALMGELAAAFARAVAPTAWPWVIGAGVGEVVPRTLFGATTVSRVVGWLRAHPDPAPVLEMSLAAAVSRLRERAGSDPSAWSWGTLRPLRLLHVLGVRRPLDRMLNVGPVPLGGDTNTVAQAGVRPLDPFDNPAAIPNHRTVIDLGDPERSRYVLAGGQSGNPLSRHYADLFERWQRGEGVPIAWSHDAVVAATVDRLLLRPQ
jgi:penicillin amidase